MEIAVDTSERRSTSPPPFDPNARDRIEQVATALLQLCEKLEMRLAAVEHHQKELDAMLMEMGSVPRG